MNRYISTTAVSAATGHHACASCKHQRKRCGPKCILAPYFPSARSRQFQAVHKVFGVSNVSKMICAVGTHEERCRATQSMVWEAEWRIKDPISGCYGEYIRLRREFDRLVAACSTTQHNNNIDHNFTGGVISQSQIYSRHGGGETIRYADPQPMLLGVNLKKGGGGDTWQRGDM